MGKFATNDVAIRSSGRMRELFHEEHVYDLFGGKVRRGFEWQIKDRGLQQDELSGK